MCKIGKVGLAVIMGVMLSLTLLVSGVFAQDTATTQDTVHTTSRVATFPANTEQGIQQMLPIAYTQNQAKTQANFVCRGRYCRTSRYYRYPRYNRYRRFYRRSGVRCYWTRRWVRGYWRSVRVCRSY